MGYVAEGPEEVATTRGFSAATSSKAVPSKQVPFSLSYASPLKGRRRGPRRELGIDGYPVWVHVYDLGPISKWTLNSLATSESHIGAFHCGVEVLGLEFSFQAVPGSKETADNISGLTWHKPKSHPRHLYRESIPLGLSPLGAPEISTLLEQLEGRWPARSYNCITRNCTDFAAQLVAGLRVPEPFPTWVHGIAKRLLGEQLEPDARLRATPRPPRQGCTEYCMACCPAPGTGSPEDAPEEEISLPAITRGPPEAEEILGGRSGSQYFSSPPSPLLRGRRRELSPLA